MAKAILGWYFAPADNRLRYGDGREIFVSETHTVEGKTELCTHGLHFSRRLIEALQYAPGPMLYRVEVWGDVREHDDKGVALNRRYLAGFDATDVLREFARRCALDVIHLWDAPDVVVRYLKTGDESIRAAAEAAAGAAAGAAAWSAAGDAVWSAAGAAAWSGAAAGAGAAVRFAAAAGAGAKQNRRLTAMVSAKLGRVRAQGVG